MKLRFILVICVLTVYRVAGSQDLSGQVFILSEQFAEDKCEVEALCDCCATELFFINKKEFVMVSRCLFDNTFLKGKYKINPKTLTLKYSKTHVNEKTDEQSGKVTCEVVKSRVDHTEFEVSQCSKKIRLRHPTITEFKNGTRHERAKEKQLKAELYKTEAWKLMK